MEPTNVSSFWSGIGIGLGCGICIGISLVALKKYIGLFPKTTQALKKYNSKEEFRLSLVVRTDLNMKKGKIAAQCGHASVGAFKKAQQQDPEALRQWQTWGGTKIALRADSLEEVLQIAANAKQLGIVTALVRDAGQTQVPPNTVTVLGVGPAPKDILDKVTGHLKLL